LENITEMLKGSLEGCVLEIIGREKAYGYEITQKLRKLGFTEVVEGTVYTILVRLEKNKLVDIEKVPSRKFYTLTKSGREELRQFWVKWNFVSTKINELQEK
jgi:PadR family transcriptional regulator PadR